MKRLFTLIVAICSIIAAMAQFPMATLSCNGELTQFTGIHAFESALNAAKLGDIIYLSEGTFSTEGTWRDISYGISIVGSGYNSKILCELRYAPSELKTMDKPLLDGVNVPSIDFFWEMPDGTKNMEIRNCHIGQLRGGGHAAENFYVNKCFIESASFGGYGDSRNIYVNNTKIRKLEDSSFNIIITNCNIKETRDCPRIVESSIIAEAIEDNGKLKTWDTGTHIINNSLFPSEEFVDEAPEVTILKNCYYENPANGLLDENLNATIDLQAKGYLGQDGTVVGAYGGENPFSELPSVPSIDSEKSSVEYDADSKKLNVTITVAKD